MVDRNHGQPDAIEHGLLSRVERAVLHRRLSRERRSQRGEIGPHDAVEDVLRQKLHHVLRREDGQRGNALAEAVVNQVREIADVVGVGMGDENGLDSSLLCEGKFGGQRAGIDRQPVVNEVPGEVVFRV